MCFPKYSVKMNQCIPGAQLVLRAVYQAFRELIPYIHCKPVQQYSPISIKFLFNFLFLVLKDPPYTVAEAGYGSFFLPVEVFFKNKEEPRKLMFDYDLVLPACGSPPIDNIRSEALTFTNPTEEFRKKLVKGGGIITSTGTVNGFHR